MILVIQQGDYTVDLSLISAIKFDLTQSDYKSADVTFSFNPFDEDFEEGENDTYTFEEEDYTALMKYLYETSLLAA